MFKKAASLLLAASLLATTSLPAFAEEVTEPIQSETTVQETQEETPAPTDVPDTTPEPEVEVTPEPTEEPTPTPTAEPESTPEPVQEEPEAVQAETPAPTETPIPLEEITDSQDVVTYEMTGETVSRIEWVADIVSALGLSVDADQFPDDYYPDVSATDEHYQALMSAVANGLIDLNAGEDFRPDEPTTREFAANTLNNRLGYIMQADSYSFTDSGDTTYADDLQVAVEQGWFALVDGKVLPQQAADAAELTAMQEKGKAAVANESIDANYASSWTFAEDVVVIPDGTMVSVDENDIVTITDCPVSLAAGQRFVAYFSGIPVPFKVVSVTENGSDTVVATTDEGTDDAITSADSETVIEVDPSNFVPAEATTYMIGDVQVVEEKTLYGIDYNKQTKTLTATRNLKLDGATGGSITIQLSNITLDSRARPNNSQIIVNADTSVTGTVNFGGELMQKIERDIDFGYINLAGGIGKIYLSLGYTLSGDVSLNMVGRAKAGFVSDNSGFRVVSDYRNDSSSIAANMDATAGIRIGASAGIPGVKGDIYARMGLELQEAIRTYSSGTPTTCENTNAWLYADASATAKVFGKSYSKSCTLYTRTNSPVRCAYHYEDGVSVQKCTRGNTSQGYTGSASGYNGKYYTSTTSKNYNPTGSSYQDEMGQTQSRFTYTLDDDGNATITGCNNITSSLVLPSEIDGHTVVAIGSQAFYKAANLASVSIPDSVTTINREAFNGCTKLASVNLPANLETLKSYAFQNCTALTEINIPASLNEAYSPFEGCSNLKTIHFEDGITQITNNLFAGCTGLTDIEIPDTVTTIGYQAFYKAANLASVSIPDSVTTIDSEAFEYCTKLTSVEIPDSVTYIGGEVFNGCTKLASVKLPANLKTLKFDVFKNCSSLTEITIPASITALPSNTFNGCTSLTKVTLPDTLSSIGNNAFQECDALTTVTIPTSVAEIGGSAFSGCDRLAEVSLSNGLKIIGDKAFYNCVSLKSITIPRTVTSLGTGAFSGDKALAEVTLGTGLTSIPTECFYQIPALTKIRIPNRVTKIGDRAFASCTKLTEVTLPAATTSISSSAFSYPARMTIYGYEGSYAQTFAGSKKIKFVARTDVDYIDVNDLTITLGTVDSYRGSPVEPTVTVKDGSVTLTKDTHYTLTYANSNTVGMASVTITGLNEAGYGSTKTIEYRIPGFTITFNAYGGTVNPTNKEVVYGQPVGELPVPVREGYSFVGWFLDDAKTQYTEDTIYTSTYDRTVYAFWSDAAAITRQPVNTTAKENANAVFTIKATGSNLTYQWQLAYAGSDNWQNVPASFAGGKTDTLTVTATKGRNGYKFRCIVKDDKNNSVTSSAATLTVEAANQPLKILSLTANKTTANPGDLITVTANVTGGAGGYTYKFIINDTTNDSWYKLQDYKGTNSIVWKATSAGTKRIMVDVKDKAGNKVATNISIKVNGTVSVPLSAELKSSAVTVKQGEAVTLTAVAKGGSGKYNYKFIINDKTDDKWYRLQDFGANNVITWKATTPGTKRLMVDVMDSTGKKIGHNITITVTK